MTQQVIELGQKAQAKRQEMADFYKRFQKVGDQAAPAMTGDDVAKFNAYNQEVNDLQKSYEDAKGVVDAADANRKALEDGRHVVRTPQYGGSQTKSIGERMLEKGFGKSKVGQIELSDMDFEETKAWVLGQKTTMTTGANGYPPQVLRDGNVVSIIQRPPQLIDYLRIDPTNQNAIKFMAQTTRTNAAVEKAEGTALDESAIVYTEQTDIISRIGTWIPVTEEQLEDEADARTLIEQDLALMVRQVLDSTLTVGSGADPILLGVFNAASKGTQTVAAAGGNVLDAILLAMNNVRITGRAVPRLCVLHGTDHTKLALTRTADGLYLLGNPGDNMFQRVWGLPIVDSEALTVTNAMVFDTDYFRVKMRKGVTVEWTNSHASLFTSSTLAARASCRAGIEHLRSQAVCVVTGLP